MQKKTSIFVVAVAVIASLASITSAQTGQMPPRQLGSLIVDEHTTAPLQLAREVELNASVERVWALVSNSESMTEYFPNVDAVSVTRDGSERTLTRGDGSVITEAIIENNSQNSTLAWSMTNSEDMGITGHLGVATVRPADERQGAILTWSYFFNHENPTQMQAQIGSIFDEVNTNLIEIFGGVATGEQQGFGDAVIVQSRIVAKPKADVWKVVGEGFADADQWSSNVASIDSESAPDGGRVGEVRACFIPSLNGATREIITAYDEDEGSLAYSIEVGLPPFATSGINEWKLSELDANHTLVTSSFHIETASGTPPQAVAFARDQFNQALSVGLDELKFFIEKGRPHPREIASRN